MSSNVFKLDTRALKCALALNSLCPSLNSVCPSFTVGEHRLWSLFIGAFTHGKQQQVPSASNLQGGPVFIRASNG